jgi:hypothetical protein
MLVILAAVVLPLGVCVAELCGPLAGIWVAVQFLTVGCIALDLEAHDPPTRKAIAVAAVLVGIVAVVPAVAVFAFVALSAIP